MAKAVITINDAEPGSLDIKLTFEPTGLDSESSAQHLAILVMRFIVDKDEGLEEPIMNISTPDLSPAKPPFPRLATAADGGVDGGATADVMNECALLHIAGNVTAKDAATRAGCSDRQVRRWVSDLIRANFGMVYGDLAGLPHVARVELAAELRLRQARSAP